MYKKRILVVEDDPKLADVIADTLSKESLDYTRAAKLSEARAIFEKNTFDLILLDVSLPDGTGFDFCQEIKKNDNIPIIFLTASSEETSEVRGLTMAEDYVKKPFSPMVLVLRIKSVLEKVKGEKISRSESEFHVDNDKNSITFKGQTLKLRPIEYKLLSLLINRSGNVLSRDVIMDRCWGDNVNSTDRAVDSTVYSIRRKLEAIDPTAKKIIINHVGVGYSLKD